MDKSPFFIKNEEVINKRKEQFDIAISNFIKYRKQIKDEDLTFIDYASETLSVVYFRFLEEHVRIAIEQFTDRYKMGSLTELIIAMIRPIRHSDEVKMRLLNAEFGYYCALRSRYEITFTNWV